MGTPDSSHMERVKQLKQRTQAIYRKKSLLSNGSYPAEQRPTNVESIRQNRSAGQKGYTVMTASGPAFTPCC
jgi:hypothetical protein